MHAQMFQLEFTGLIYVFATLILFHLSFHSHHPNRQSVALLYVSKDMVCIYISCFDLPLIPHLPDLHSSTLPLPKKKKKKKGLGISTCCYRFSYRYRIRNKHFILHHILELVEQFYLKDFYNVSSDLHCERLKCVHIP